MNDGIQSKPCLLITGASGLLGSVLCKLAAPRWSVWGVYHTFQPQTQDWLQGVDLIRVDLTRRDETDAMLRKVHPRAVIHAAAVADVDQCQRHPDRTAGINVGVPDYLAVWCAQQDIPYAFISTDLVFNGQQAPYDEASPVNPINVYGNQKAQAEIRVMRQYAKAVVFRLPLMIGISPIAYQRESRHFCRQMLEAIQMGRELTLFTDEYRTPVDIESAARGILSLMDRAAGILHLGGLSRISRYELGLMMAAAMGRQSDMIRGILMAEKDLAVSRARDVSLNSERALGMGYAPSALKRAVQSVVDQYLVISKG